MRAQVAHFVSLLAVFAAAACSASEAEEGPNRIRNDTPPAGDPNAAPSTTGLVPAPSASGPDFGGMLPPPTNTTGLPNACDGRPKTSIRATVYDPAGRLPLYNVMVYVPTAPLAPIAEGVSCDRCDATASGSPIAAALSNPQGEFVMENVPDGDNVPMVIQMGKWRREITLPQVLPCQENVFTDRELFRLPRSQAEGHLPKVAMVTGGADKLECMLRKLGIADTEFTNPDGAGRVNLFADTDGVASFSAGGTFPAASTLLGSAEALARYDVVIMSCHGKSAQGRAQTTADKTAMKAYVDQGGRVFGSHFHFSYLRGDDDNHLPTPFPDVGVWDGENPDTYSIDQSFPKGQAFAQWLNHVGASPTLGTIALESVEGAASLLDTPFTQSWITAPNSIPYFSINMPVEKVATPDEQCGRFVHTGIHVSEGEEDPFPAGCESEAPTPQESALEFLLFDLSACPLRVDVPPAPPPIILR